MAARFFQQLVPGLESDRLGRSATTAPSQFLANPLIPDPNRQRHVKS